MEKHELKQKTKAVTTTPTTLTTPTALKATTEKTRPTPATRPTPTTPTPAKPPTNTVFGGGDRKRIFQHRQKRENRRHGNLRTGARKAAKGNAGFGDERCGMNKSQIGSREGNERRHGNAIQ